MNKLKVLELFAGIGAVSKALTRLGIDFEIVDAVEIDKFAVKSFNAIHNTDFLPQDICKWDKDIDVDLICHGSPCQDFSCAGLGMSGNKNSGTRSSLMWETVRIVEKLSPKYIIWENVKNVLSKLHIHNFDEYLKKLSDLGYINYYKVLNAKDYGIPQNRERLFVISIRNDINVCYKFPERVNLVKSLRDVLEDDVNDKYYLSDLAIEKMKRNARNYTPCGISPTLTTELAHSTGKNLYPKLVKEIGYRRLTPKECFRLMGFDDIDCEKVSKINSDTQIYKQCANSIVVNILVGIFKNLLIINEKSDVA